MVVVEQEIKLKASTKQRVALRYLLDKETKNVLYGGGAGGGKSYLLCLWIFCMAYKYPDTRWFIGREELKRLRESTLVTLYKVLHDYDIPKGDYGYNGADNFMQFYNGSRISLLDLRYLPSDPLYERYGSVEYTGGAIEEGGEVNFGAFDVLKTRVGRHNNTKYGLLGKILITANPKKNWLYKLFYLPFKEGTMPSQYAFIPALAKDNPYLDHGYIENLDSITDPITRERLRDGNWEYDDNKNQLIAYDRILDLMTNAHVKGGGKYITADIARFGKDKTTIGYWDGYRLEQIIAIDKNSITEAAREIRLLANVRGVPMSRVIVDEDGIGGGVKDILNCKGFIANTRPVEVKGKPCNFNHIKSQVSFMFADAVNEATVFINCPGEQMRKEIVEEVEQIRSHTVDNDTKVSIMPKDKVKENIHRSPDYSDMIVMRWWFDLPHTTQNTRWSIN